MPPHRELSVGLDRVRNDVTAAFVGSVTVDGHRLEYSEFGSGDRVVVLTHPFLMSRKMVEPWARALAEKGFRVICLNLLGDTPDGKPLDLSRYNSEALGTQVLRAMDALGIDSAVLGGTSIGSNVSMEAAFQAPDRVIGLLLEGPFLDRSVSASAYAWTPILSLFTVGRPLVHLGGLVARALPENGGITVGIVGDLLRLKPDRASAFIRGMTIGRVGPPRAIRQAITTPTLILSLAFDPAHSAADANDLAIDIPGAQLIRGGTLATLRYRPHTVTPAMISFLTEVYGPRPKAAVTADPTQPE